ncbi:hypothetical protein CALCODRAFT_201288 [Calocera cornea HHB12733]|uniref:Uncharacterized protein n=1 Tax=Calocera cornea HHB12733 TaxID=1353952 RepID=A0A165C4U0_9BASI|nr:hypothetical protein CALCODRAFT_201288 [Calocera cornea HHB12733]
MSSSRTYNGTGVACVPRQILPSEHPQQRANMPLTAYTKLDAIIATTFCFGTSLALVTNPGLTLDSPIARVITVLTGYPVPDMSSISHANAVGAYGFFVAGMNYALALWSADEQAMRNAALTRIAVAVYGVGLVVMTDLGGSSILMMSVMDLMVGSILHTVLRRTRTDLPKTRRD